MCMSKYTVNPGTLPSVEVKLPTSPSLVCHEMMWGFHCVCHYLSVFFLTRSHSLCIAVRVLPPKACDIFTNFMYSQQRRKIQIPTTTPTSLLFGLYFFVRCLGCAGEVGWGRSCRPMLAAGQKADARVFALLCVGGGSGLCPYPSYLKQPALAGAGDRK